MNHAPLVSDLVDTVCKHLKPFEHSGAELAPVAVSTLLKNLFTIRELARDQEQELEIQRELRRTDAGRQTAFEQRVSARVDAQAGTNVVRLPTRLRVFSASPDGGDAA